MVKESLFLITQCIPLQLNEDLKHSPFQQHHLEWTLQKQVEKEKSQEYFCALHIWVEIVLVVENYLDEGNEAGVWVKRVDNASIG